MRTFVCAVTLAVALALDPAPLQAQNPHFNRITPDEIAAYVAQYGRSQIDGSDNASNEIPPGTILVYVTSDFRFGKLKVQEYGYNLLIKWVTYDDDGSVFSSGQRFLIRGTYFYDLDFGREVNSQDSEADFWWEQVDNTTRYWVAANGALFAVYQ
jgi:hypothetical protein